MHALVCIRDIWRRCRAGRPTDMMCMPMNPNVRHDLLRQVIRHVKSGTRDTHLMCPFGHA